MRRARAVGLVFALAGTCGAAWGEDESGESRILITPKTRAAAGASYGAPLGASAGIEVLHGLGADVQEDSDRVKALAGVLLQLHAGTGGGKLSLGLGARANVRSEDFRGTAFAGLKASLVRTWGSPVSTGRHVTYLGPELEVSVLRVDVALGALARLRGDTGKRVLFAWSVGARF